MARIFENPANGYRESAGFAQGLLTFMFCLPYLAIKGLWSHFLVVLLFIALPMAAGGAPLAFFGGLFVSLVYAFLVPGLLAAKYQRQGWREVTVTMSDSGLPAAAGSDRYRTCPMCAEEVRREAIRCKHCGAQLDPLPPVQVETPEEAAARLGIRRADHLFIFTDRQFTRIEDAIAFAKAAHGEGANR